MKKIHQQLRAMWVASGDTLAETVAGAGLRISDKSLSRKLRGRQVLSDEEIEALAVYFEGRVSFGGGVTAP